MKRFFSLAPILILTLSAGCTYYSVNPQGVSGVPRESSALPLRVGISWTPPQKWKAYPFYLMSTIAGDQYKNCTVTGTPKAVCDKRYKDWTANEHWNPEHHQFGALFAKKLQAAHLFQDVVFPIPPSLAARAPVDLIINLDPVKESFDSADLGLELFIPLTVPLCDPFLIGCPLVNTTDTFSNSARVTLTDKSGKELKSYSGSGKAATVYPDFNAPPLPGSADIDASNQVDEQLAVALVKALVNDKSYFAGIAGESSQPAAAAPAVAQPAPAAAGAAAKSWWQQ